MHVVRLPQGSSSLFCFVRGHQVRRPGTVHGLVMRGGASLLFDLSIAVLFAQEEGAAPNQFGTLMPLITFGMVMLLYMFMMQRPKMKREQEARENMMKNLKKNDRIV